MNKTSKVKSVNLVTDQNGQPKVYNGQYGTMYFHALQFENGDTGEYMSKSPTQDKFIQGQEADYDIQPNTNPAFPSKIKPVQSYFKGGKKNAPSLEGFAARYATDILIAYINNGQKIEKKWFDEWATYIKAWMEGSKAETPSIPKPQDDDSDSLPF